MPPSCSKLASDGTEEQAMSIGGLSRARLAGMHDVMAGYVGRGEVPGLVTLVSRRGEVHVDAIGMKALGGSEPMRRDTIFRIASLTKPITAAAAMILVEECRLRLDEPVDRLLPELADRKVLKRIDGPLDDTVPAKRPITVRDLLTFRMGFGIIMEPPDTYPIQRAVSELLLGQGMPNPSTPPAPDEWIRRLGTLPLLHQPGEKWMYHTGSDVLGVLIARASGQPLETFLRERIFGPLGMKDTGFSVPAAKIDRLATSYWVNPETAKFELYDEADWRPMEPPARISVRRRGARLDHRRLPGLWPDDAEQGKARKKAHPVEAFRRDHDDRPVDAGAEGGLRSHPRLLRQPRLGVRRVHRHPARRRGVGTRTVRLGRRPGHFLVFGSPGGDGHHPDDTERLDVPQSAGCLPRLLDLGLPGD